MALGSPARWAESLDEANGDAMAWVYFGRSTELYLELRRSLSEGARLVASGPLVGAVVDELRDELLGFDDALEYRDPMLWHAGDLAERLQTGSTFVYSCAAAIACARLLDSLGGGLLVVVDDAALRSVVLELARNRGARAEPVGGDGPSPLAAWARAIRERVSFVSQLARRRRLLRRLGAAPLPRQLDVLLVTWADSSTFVAGAHIEHETYFGVLPRLFRERGLRTAYLTIPLSWVEPVEPILRNAVASLEAVVFPEQCVSVAAGIRIALRSLAVPARLRRPHVVGGVDLSSMLSAELHRERLRVRRCFALQFECVAGALRRRGLEIGRILHPFENQSWEKVLHLGVREQLPATRIVGFQTSQIPANWFSFSPSRRDLEAGLLPDEVIVFGAIWRRLLADRGYPSDALKLGAPLRFSHLQGITAARAPGRRVLAATPIGLDDSLELAWKAVQAFADEPDVALVLRLHPKMDRVSRERFARELLLAAGLEQLPDHIVVSERPAAELLAEARVLLYSSTVLAYEALAFGVTPVFLQPDFWLDMNSLPPGSTVAPVARTADEIRAVVLDLLGESEERTERRRQAMARLLADAFAPVTPETLSPFA